MQGEVSSASFMPLIAIGALQLDLLLSVAQVVREEAQVREGDLSISDFNLLKDRESPSLRLQTC